MNLDLRVSAVRPQLLAALFLAALAFGTAGCGAKAEPTPPAEPNRAATGSPAAAPASHMPSEMRSAAEAGGARLPGGR